MHIRQLCSIGLIVAMAILNGQPAAASDGKAIFGNNCASCHGNKGQGTPGLAPALKGDTFVTGSKAEDVLTTVKNGRAGDQKKFKDMPIAMPAWGGKLSDADIQAVVDFIRKDLQKQ
jgi:cytochrome c oxidase cbb3-type subunit 3